MRNVSEIKRTRYSVVFHLEQSANGIESEELCRIKKKIKKKKKLGVGTLGMTVASRTSW